MDPFIGSLMLVGFNFAPRGWAKCEGQLLAISENSALFSLLGTTYGGDGKTTFALPDLRGRVSLHEGNGPGLSDYNLGQRGGAETVALTAAEMPQHSHDVAAQSGTGTADDPNGAVLAGGTNVYSNRATNVNMDAATIVASGGGQAHENRQPYLVMNWVIALQGIYPSRS